MAKLTGYIGTYSSPRSRGLYRFTVDTDSGALTPPVLFFEGRDMKCPALLGDTLAAPIQQEGRAGVVLLDRGGPGRRLDAAFDEAVTSSYLLLEDEWLWAANFHEGRVLAYHRRGAALERPRAVSFGEGAGCHQVLRHGRFLLVPCMNLDKVAVLDGARELAEVGSLPFPAGSGPRHGIFDAAHRFFYLATQFGHGVHAFRVKDGGFAPEGVFPIFQGDAPAGAETAAVRLSPGGRYLYVSTRGADVLTVFAVDGPLLRKTQQISCGGAHPRDMILTPDGRFLLALNRDSDNLVSFPLDRATGQIGGAAAETTIAKGSGIVFAESPGQ